MTLPNQDVGTDAASPVLRGGDIFMSFNVTPLASGEVASAIYRMLTHVPGTPGASEVLNKTTGGGGIAFADAAAGVDFDVTLDPADTASLHADDYYHELEITKSNGDVRKASTGTIRLTAGGPALI